MYFNLVKFNLFLYFLLQLRVEKHLYWVVFCIISICTLCSKKQLQLKSFGQTMYTFVLFLNSPPIPETMSVNNTK